MAGLTWYWQRLTRMSAVEIGYRVRQAIQRKLDKYAVPSARRIGSSPVLLRIPVLSSEVLRESCRTFEGLALRYADNARIHRFEIFGQVYDAGREINWHRDPKTDKEWPIRYWGDIDYRDGKSIGGIKFAWELNRLQHLPQLALGYALTGEEGYRRELFLQIENWLRCNPYPLGINWISGIELGVRVVNAFFAVRFLGADDLTDDERSLLERFFVLHATHLYRYPSKYSSCANHALAEALGLVVASVACPGHRKANRWREFGQEVLDREVGRQIYQDGSSFEHSVPYLSFVVEHYFIYRLICRLYGLSSTPLLDDRLQSAIDFMRSITDCKGNYPLIGDDDDGCLLKLNYDGKDNQLSMCCLGAAVFSRPAWIPDDNDLDVKSRLLVLDQADSGFRYPPTNAEIPAATAHDVRYYEKAGIAVYRCWQPNDEILFIGNSGPLGLPPLAGHGHSDALSIWLTVNGEQILVDPGTYLYHSGGKWRSYFRSTAAHNTLRIDTKDQADIVADFMFDVPYRIQGRIEKSGEEEVVWEGWHDGYQRLSEGVRHRRIVRIGKCGRLFDIRDEIETQGLHNVECFFHFHPQCDVQVTDRIVKVRTAGIRINMVVDEKWQTVAAKRGEENPLAGWYSPKFNRLQKTTTLVLRKETEGDSSFRTTMEISTEGSR